MAGERARTSPDRFYNAAGDPGLDLTVIVAPEDEARARKILREWRKDPGIEPMPDD